MRRALAAAVCAFALQATATVTGTVIAIDGAPIANVQIAAMEPPLPFPLSLRAPEAKPLAVATTNATGEFALDVKGNGIVDVRIRRDGFLPVDLLTPSSESVGTITLRSSTMVEGRVTAAGKPVPNARVFVVGMQSTLTVTTDDGGKYRIPDPTTWAQSISVIHPKYAPAFHPAASRDFALDSGRTVRGKVVDANDKPVAGATVDLSNLLSTKTAADGSFVFQNAPAQAMAVRVLAPGGAAAAIVTSPSLILKVRPAVSISGVVRDADKHTVSGIAVFIGNETAMDAVITDGNGRFAFAAMPSGIYQIMAMAGTLYASDSQKVDAAREVKVDLIAKRQEEVAGRVVTDDGQPVAGAAIVLVMSTRGMSVAAFSQEVTGADGRFRVRAGEASESRRIAAVKA